MPEKKTVESAKRDLRRGKRPSTAVGEFAHEEIEHIRSGKHGARSTKQALAIGLSKARRAGVPLKPPSVYRAKASARRKAERDYEVGRSGRHRPSPDRSHAVTGALRRERSQAASKRSRSRQAKRTRRPRHR